MYKGTFYSYHLFFFLSFFLSFLKQGLEYTDCIAWRKVKPLQKEVSLVGYQTTSDGTSDGKSPFLETRGRWRSPSKKIVVATNRLFFDFVDNYQCRQISIAAIFLHERIQCYILCTHFGLPYHAIPFVLTLYYHSMPYPSYSPGTTIPCHSLCTHFGQPFYAIHFVLMLDYHFMLCTHFGLPFRAVPFVFTLDNHSVPYHLYSLWTCDNLPMHAWILPAINNSNYCS